MGGVKALTGGLGHALGTDSVSADQARINDAIQAQKDARDSMIAQQSQQQGLLDTEIGNQANSRGTVTDSLSLLQGAANGTAPSVTQGVLQQGLDQGIAAQAALANSGSMANQLAKQRAAADVGANLTQQTANQAGQLRAQEMATARGQFNQGAQGLQQSDIAAQQGTSGDIASLLGQQSSSASSQASAATGATSLDQQGAMQAQANRAKVTGSVMNAAGGFLGMSHGGEIPGKEVVKGDSQKNDMYHYLLSAGEIVIPKSATTSMEKAVKFLEQYIGKKEKSEKSEKGEKK